MICSICKLEKTNADFNFKIKKENLLCKHCKECQKLLRRKSYQKNREYFLNYQKTHFKQWRKERKDFIKKYKEKKPCVDCKQIYPHYVMDFDHLPEFKKEIKIGSRGFYHSEDVLVKEFEKCELVCSNCHRIRTWKRKNGKLNE